MPLDRSYANLLFALMELIFRQIASVPSIAFASSTLVCACNEQFAVIVAGTAASCTGSFDYDIPVGTGTTITGKLLATFLQRPVSGTLLTAPKMDWPPSPLEKEWLQARTWLPKWAAGVLF